MIPIMNENPFFNEKYPVEKSCSVYEMGQTLKQIQFHWIYKRILMLNHGLNQMIKTIIISLLDMLLIQSFWRGIQIPSFSLRCYMTVCITPWSLWDPFLMPSIIIANGSKCKIWMIWADCSSWRPSSLIDVTWGCFTWRRSPIFKRSGGIFWGNRGGGSCCCYFWNDRGIYCSCLLACPKFGSGNVGRYWFLLMLLQSFP